MLRPLLPLLLVAAAACTPVGAPQKTTAPSLPAMPAQDTCNAARYRATLGKPVTVLENQLHVGQVRILRPNTPMTMDLRPNRINFHVTEDGKIERISCV